MTSNNDFKAAVLDVAILCGGLGTRLRPLVTDRPKAMVEINGKPFLEILIKYFRKFGFRRFVLCTGHLADAIARHFGDGKQWNLEIVYSPEDRALGTAGAIKYAKDKIDSDPFLVLNGDSFVKADPNDLVKFHLAHDADISLLLVKVNEARRFGSVTLAPDFRIVEFAEKRRTAPGGWINAGMYVISQKILNLIPPLTFASLENQVFAGRVKELKIFGLPTTGPFIDIGLPEAFSYLQKHFAVFFEEALFV